MMTNNQEIQNLKWKLYKKIYNLSDKYNKSIKTKMVLYRNDWDNKIELFGLKIKDKLLNEIKWINGLTKKEFCMMFGKKPKDKFNKSKNTKGMRNFRYSKYRGGLPKGLKQDKDKNKHIVDNRKFIIRNVGVEE